ncbi:MAG: polyribonucleotide nucleotidyltransferase [Chloroflexi bacterium]|nr:polyribonucleotide nucleotidyltransferase [Chloroflexota bacterium]
MKQTFTAEIAGRTLTLETGRMAQLADGAVLAQYGDTMVLATVVSSNSPREGIDFLPLTIEFEEKMYAAGKIPGGFFKREGRAPESAILNARMIDRPMRPLFPKDYHNEIQVVITVLSVDLENDPGALASIAASAAISISDVPFHGPVGAVGVGFIDGEFILNPTLPELAFSRLDLAIAGTADAVMMVEAGALELPEDTMVQAIEFGHNAIRQIVELQNRMVAAVGKPKRAYPPDPTDDVLKGEARELVNGRLVEAVLNADKMTREGQVAGLRSETVASLVERGFDEKQAAKVFDSLEKETVRDGILDRGIRPDGRALNQIREVTCEVGVLPRAHGSSLFTRGQTQVLGVATLGTGRDNQIIDGIGIEDHRNFMNHYNFPPFSTGEAKRMTGPSRRDIGHGHLVERSLLSVMPDQVEFPYTVRVVDEVLASNGSSSMGSVCAATMALMDAGVPIKAPVAGIAMGLITREGGTYKILTDIQGVEDFLGDMDFKVAGTATGVCGLQMDIKVRGITPQIMREAVMQAREARLFILDKMQAAIEETRPELSKFAPRITKITINPDRIRDIIGPGGKMIRHITEETKCTIEVEDDGSVLIGSNNAENTQKAIDMIRGLTRDVEVGTVYTGKVTRIMNFGAFVEILPGKEGLVHISELADYHVDSVEDVVKVGDEVTVLVSEIDRMGRVNLSRRALLAPRENGEAGPAGGGNPEGRPAFREGGGRPPFRGGEGGGGRPPFRGGGEGGGRPPFRGGGEGGGRPPFRGGGEGGGPRPPFNRPPGQEGRAPGQDGPQPPRPFNPGGNPDREREPGEN